MKRMRIGILVGLLSIVTLMFNHCSPFHDAPSVDQSSGDGGVAVDDQLQIQALEVINVRCSTCHGASGMGGVSYITDVDHLISSGLIVPGDPNQGRLMGSIMDGSMPQGATTMPGLPQDEVDALAAWISSMQASEGPGDNDDSSEGGSGSGDMVPSFQVVYDRVLGPKCFVCHEAGHSHNGVRYDTYEETLKTVTPFNASQSLLYTSTASGYMPPASDGYSALSADDMKMLENWINAGAPR